MTRASQPDHDPDRRRLLRRAATVAVTTAGAGVAATVGLPGTARAAPGDRLTMGTTNDAGPATTTLSLGYAGLTRAMLAFLLEAYDEDEAPNAKGGVDKRTVMRFDKRLAPVKVAVLPLSRNADLTPKAKALAAELRKSWNVEFDDAGAIGRRYRRQDEIGTPFCVTIDFDTLNDQAVTVRERDSMKQERIGIDALPGYLADLLPLY